MKIDIGDLTLSAQQSSRQTALFIAIRDKITLGYWETNSKLPSTRQLSQALSVSRNTVIAAYEQLVAEGYIQSKASSGYYISARLPEHYLTTAHNQHALAPTSLQPQVNNTNNAFAPGVPDLANFPSKKWQRLYQQQFDRKSFLGCNDLQGDINFRQVLSHYL